MTKDEAQKHVADLAKKASTADGPDAALKFSQAACNLADVYGALMHSEPPK